MSEQGLSSVAFSEGDIMTSAGSTATIDVDVGSGAETPSQIDERLKTVVRESRNIMADVESVTSEAPVTLAGGAPTLSTAPSSGTLIKPETPLMGGLRLVTKDEWLAWTGGKPSLSWSGLDPFGGVLEHTSPNQLRPVYVLSAQKGCNFRRQGHKTLFKPADDLISFQNIVWNHLKDTGMDSIAYLRDPTD